MTPKQQAFVREYLVDLNATQAAIRAGYSAATAGAIGAENLTKPAIAAAIAAAQDERARRVEIDADAVLRGIEAVRLDAMREHIDALGNRSMTNHAAALKAAELQGRHLGMWNDKLKLQGKVEVDAVGELREFLKGGSRLLIRGKTDESK